jgi:NADPH2:quinone reductase
MKVIAISEFGGTENFFEVERDTPRPRADEVLIRIRAGSFNPIDYKIRQGRYGGDLPMVLGHDAAGVIEELGSSVGRLRVGDEVWAYLGGPCSNGANAEYAAVPQEFVTVRPRILSIEEAASVPVASLTANQAIRLKARPTPNDSVFVAGGAGGLGSAAIQILQMIGARKDCDNIRTGSQYQIHRRSVEIESRAGTSLPRQRSEATHRRSDRSERWLSFRQDIGFRGR